MTFCIIIIRNFNLSRFFSEFLCWDSIFYQKSLPIQLLLYPLEGGFVRAAEGVQVDAIGELGEDVGFVLGDGLQELAYVIAGAQLELSRQLAIDRMLYDDVQDAAAVIDAEVINIHTIKPLDEDLVIASAQKTGKVVTVEEHSVIGGLGSAVCDALSEKAPTKVMKIGVYDRFGESGPGAELIKKYELDAESIYKKVKGFLS